MDLQLLQRSVAKFQGELFAAIRTKQYGGNQYADGQKAKEALIRSQSLIMNIHESVKRSFLSTLTKRTKHNWNVYPPVGSSKPELKIYGRLKAKDQDLVYLRTALTPSKISSGPNEGETDQVGEQATSKAIVIGVRSQMSSVDKNFDTLMERAFAETLNLRLRVPVLTMGEVYVLPLEELDDREMVRNRVAFKAKKVNVPKFVKIFNAFSGRKSLEIEEQYKYDATALVLIDLKSEPAQIVADGDDLKEYGFSQDIVSKFEMICPSKFDERLLKSYESFQRQVGL